MDSYLEQIPVIYMSTIKEPSYFPPIAISLQTIIANHGQKTAYRSF